ncbi:ankyrin repeat domain-containing protein, partial [Escherichia coli]
TSHEVRFLRAIEARDVEAVGKLTREHPELLSTPFDGEGTPLHWAAKHADSSFVEKLLEFGADASATDEDGCTPLQIAIQ